MDVQREAVGAHIGKQWWLVALRGVIAIIFGLLAFFYPGVTLVVLLAFFGAYMFVDGIFALVQAIRFRHQRQQWPSLLLEGILGIVAGLITYFYPGITALVWVFTIAAWAIVTGGLEIYAAIKLRQYVPGEIFLAISGIVSILLGIGFAILPRAGLLAAIWITGAYAIIFGLMLLSLAFRLRPMGTGMPTGAVPSH